ncbi:MAG: hypothetical protein IT440_00355 [Phycisphaeraceae bacterium]|nr:hypothetical protein [Phycisphaeraceae bacterium]
MSRATLLIVALAALTGCAGAGDYRERQDARLAEFEAHAGPPVDRISLYTRLDGWNALAPDQLAIFLGVNRVYLLNLKGPCSGLEFQQQIGISSSNNTVDARFDKVYFEHQVCWIKQIRPVDYKALKRARREDRQPGT